MPVKSIKTHCLYGILYSNFPKNLKRFLKKNQHSYIIRVVFLLRQNSGNAVLISVWALNPQAGNFIKTISPDSKYITQTQRYHASCVEDCSTLIAFSLRFYECIYRFSSYCRETNWTLFKISNCIVIYH